MTVESVGIQDVVSRVPIARRLIAGAVYRTPLEPSPWLSDVCGAEVALKLECFQPTGSFKVRGAIAAIAQLSAEERARGVIAATAGNHGLGIAYAAQRTGVGATIVVPETASSAKISALRRFPVELFMRGADFDAAERVARRMAQERNAVFISPYNDLQVMAGQATIGPEILEDMPEMDIVLIPAGGGAILAGIGAWLKSIRPTITVIGVQSEASPAMAYSLRAGHLVERPILPSLADGISGNIEPGSITFPLSQAVVDDVVLVREEEIASAIKESYRELRLALEGSAVVGIAALLNRHLPDVRGKRIVVIVTGRNIAAERLREILA